MLFSSFMTFGALAIRENGTYVPFSADAWSYAGQMTLLGIGMVFAVLAILWAVLGIFKLVFAGSQPKQAKPEKKPEVKAEKAPTAPVTAPAPVAQSSDAELVAIITAAVAAYMAEEGTEYAGDFRVVSFKRVRGGRTWNSK